MSDLRALAENATPGPWHVTNNRGHAGIKADKWAIVDPQVGSDGFGSGGVYSPDAEYIAACSPDVILGLLGELDGLRAIVNDTFFAGDLVVYEDSQCRWNCQFCALNHWRFNNSTEILLTHHDESCVYRRAVAYKEGQP